MPQALKLDLAACIILAAGNDYLPAVRGFLPAKSGLDRLWDCYLGVRATKRYHARCAAQGRLVAQPWSTTKDLTLS